jgi:aspartokinase/homoserine dehydrogenase 1
VIEIDCPRRVDVVIAGASGRVAGALGALLAGREGGLRAAGLAFRVVGLARSHRQRWSEAGLAPAALAHALESGEPATAEEVVTRTLAWPRRPACFVDCTPSEPIAARYTELLAAGVAVVTPNKRGSAGPQARWRDLRAFTAGDGAAYRDSTTVGAGLPVLASLRALRSRGDSLRRATGVLSGSISYVLRRVQEDVPFSQAVTEARALGYTEPHPFDDLSGEDVARKWLIVLREAGRTIERDALAVKPLAPAKLGSERDPGRFLARLRAHDAPWRRRVRAARATGRRLVYAARFDGARARVGLLALPAEDAFARLRPAENMVALFTEHYDPLPLTIAGPGAGPELTAAGLLTDLLSAVAQGPRAAQAPEAAPRSRAASAW